MRSRVRSTECALQKKRGSARSRDLTQASTKTGAELLGNFSLSKHATLTLYLQPGFSPWGPVASNSLRSAPRLRRVSSLGE